MVMKKRPTSSKNYFNFNLIIEGSILIVSIETIDHALHKGIDPSVKNARSLTDSMDHL
jgi:hypothetical protein